MDKDGAVSFGIGMLTGLVIGGALALLYAPQSGRDTRHAIKEKAVEVEKMVKDKSHEISDMVKEELTDINHKRHAAMQALKD